MGTGAGQEGLFDKSAVERIEPVDAQQVPG